MFQKHVFVQSGKNPTTEVMKPESFYIKTIANKQDTATYTKYVPNIKKASNISQYHKQKAN